MLIFFRQSTNGEIFAVYTVSLTFRQLIQLVKTNAILLTLLAKHIISRTRVRVGAADRVFIRTHNSNSRIGGPCNIVIRYRIAAAAKHGKSCRMLVRRYSHLVNGIVHGNIVMVYISCAYAIAVKLDAAAA